MAAFESSASSVVNETPLKSLQYSIQRDWLSKGQVPQAEIILWSRGEVDPVPNASYIYILGGAMVCTIFTPVFPLLIHHKASNEQGRCGKYEFSFFEARRLSIGLWQHIVSSDPLAAPAIEAEFLTEEFGESQCKSSSFVSKLRGGTRRRASPTGHIEVHD